MFCRKMGDARDNDAYEEELLDYEEEEDKAPDSVNAKANGEAAKRFAFFHFLVQFCCNCSLRGGISRSRFHFVVG